jgi:hypothetical protein
MEIPSQRGSFPCEFLPRGRLGCWVVMVSSLRAAYLPLETVERTTNADKLMVGPYKLKASFLSEEA